MKARKEEELMAVMVKALGCHFVGNSLTLSLSHSLVVHHGEASVATLSAKLSYKRLTENSRKLPKKKDSGWQGKGGRLISTCLAGSRQLYNS